MKLTKKKRKPSLRREIATYNHIARELKREATPCLLTLLKNKGISLQDLKTLESNGPSGQRKEKRKNVR